MRSREENLRYFHLARNDRSQISAEIRQFSEAELVAVENELQTWIERELSIRFDKSFYEALKDGVILCNLCVKLDPSAIQSSKIRNAPRTSPSQSRFSALLGNATRSEMATLSMCARNNVPLFLDWCRAQRIPTTCLFDFEDLFEVRNRRQVVSCLACISKIYNNDHQNHLQSFTDQLLMAPFQRSASASSSSSLGATLLDDLDDVREQIYPAHFAYTGGADTQPPAASEEPSYHSRTNTDVSSDFEPIINTSRFSTATSGASPHLTEANNSPTATSVSGLSRNGSSASALFGSSARLGGVPHDDYYTTGTDDSTTSSPASVPASPLLARVFSHSRVPSSTSVRQAHVTTQEAQGSSDQQRKLNMIAVVELLALPYIILYSIVYNLFFAQ